MNLYIKIGDECSNSNFDSALFYYNKALQLIDSYLLKHEYERVMKESKATTFQKNRGSTLS